MKIKAMVASLVIATGAMAAMSAHAQTSINLSNYSVSAIYGLDRLNGTTGGISGLEGSAITYARDRGTLFFVGDEGTGVIEISKTGGYLGHMNFDWTGTGSTKHDTEGLTYLGGGQLVVGEERLQDAYKFAYTAGGTVTLSNSFVSMSNVAVGNNGMEGITYDPRDGSFITIKQQSPQNILSGTLSFAAATGGLPGTLIGDGVSPTGGGVSTLSSLFNPALMGLTTLSDVQTLSPVDALFGSAAADNLLVLSLGSRKLVEVNRSGTLLSTFDLSGVLNSIGGDFNAIEGVTVDELGTIYLVAEQLQGAGATVTSQSQLIVLTAPVPEPGTWALLLAGLAFVGFTARRRLAGFHQA
jgi:uncharacterized protein YjiK